MLPDRVSNPGPPTYESGALPIALRGPAAIIRVLYSVEVISGRWNGDIERPHAIEPTDILKDFCPSRTYFPLTFKLLY